MRRSAPPAQQLDLFPSGRVPGGKEGALPFDVPIAPKLSRAHKTFQQLGELLRRTTTHHRRRHETKREHSSAA